MEEIARRYFWSLHHDTFYGKNSRHYIVLNDGNYKTDFYADSESDAISIFNDLEDK